MERKALSQVVVAGHRLPTAAELPLGATVWGGGVAFLVWAPKAASVALVIEGQDPIVMAPVGHGYQLAFVKGAGAGTRYGYRLNGQGSVLPDPVSLRQPDGVFALSEVVDPSHFGWSDAAWRGLPISKMDITEAHLGTLTPAGTFGAAKEAVQAMAANAIELMPLHQFPGTRNWGYDPAQLFAVHNSYGTPDDLRALINAAHQAGKALVHDVVHNHPGPEGAFAGSFGSYFEGPATPWGGGVSVDGPAGREISRYFIENAVLWLNDYHFDALRFDATAFLPLELLVDLRRAVNQLERLTGRTLVLISEHNRNERLVCLPIDQGGHGFDGQWSMDLQYALRALLLNEKGWRIDRYTDDPFGWASRAVARGWAYQGEHSPVENQPFGTSTSGLPPASFVVAKDDHDQIGNTARGTRLGHRLGPALDRAVDALYGFLPFTLMNFMGDEYRAPQPFNFFVDVGEPLAGQIRNGRNHEWAAWLGDAVFPDPNAPDTFRSNKLDPRDREAEAARRAAALALQLAQLRTGHPVLQLRSALHYQVVAYRAEQAWLQRRWTKEGTHELLALTNLSDQPVSLDLISGGALEPTSDRAPPRRPLGGKWSVLLNTDDPQFGGNGVAFAAVDLDQQRRVTVAAHSAVYLQQIHATTR